VNRSPVSLFELYENLKQVLPVVTALIRCWRIEMRKRKKLFAKTCQSSALNAYIQVFSWRVLKPQVFPPLPVGDAPALPRSLRQAERGIFLPTV
jgi:hypothetical protein